MASPAFLTQPSMTNWRLIQETMFLYVSDIWLSWRYDCRIILNDDKAEVPTGQKFHIFRKLPIRKTRGNHHQISTGQNLNAIFLNFRPSLIYFIVLNSPFVPSFVSRGNYKRTNLLITRISDERAAWKEATMEMVLPTTQLLKYQ